MQYVKYWPNINPKFYNYSFLLDGLHGEDILLDEKVQSIAEKNSINYLTFVNRDIRKLFKMHNLVDIKGQFLTKIDKDQYIGLTEGGPIICSKSMWKTIFKNEYKQYYNLNSELVDGSWLMDGSFNRHLYNLNSDIDLIFP